MAAAHPHFVTLLDGKVLDRWHRYTAAREIDPGLGVPAVELSELVKPPDWRASE